MRIVVTGAAGFIGSTLAERLASENHELLLIDDLSTGKKANLEAVYAAGVAPDSFHRLDVADPRAARIVERFKPEVMMLLGAQMSVKVSMTNPMLDAHSNVLGVINMTGAATRAGVRKVVLASSGGTIYGAGTAGQDATPESAPKVPESFYGLTKFVGVEYLRIHALHHGLEYAGLALGNVYGPRQDPHGEAGVIAIFLDRMRRGLACLINGDGRQTRDYVHVDDVVDAFVRAGSWGDGLYNVGTGVETSVLQIHELLSAAIGTDRPPRFSPALAGDLSRVRLDSTRARRELGWSPRLNLNEGLRSLVNESVASHEAT